MLIAVLAMAGISGLGYLGWLLFRLFWNKLWDWHENELTTKRGDLR